MKVVETLVLPTGLTSDGGWESAPIDITHKKNEQLLDLIRGYGLKPTFRNKASYKECLAEFSSNRDSWDTLKRSPPNMHKGTRRQRRTINLASRLKNPLNAAQHAAYSGHASLDDPTPVNTREGARLVSWAAKFLEETADPQHQEAPSTPIIPPNPPAQGSSSKPPSLTSSGDVSLASLVSDLCRVHDTTQNLLKVALGGQVVPQALGLTTGIRDALDLGQPVAADASSKPERTPSETSVTLAMKEQTITIPSTDIPDPPPLRSHGNIEFVNAIWDDTPETWNHSSPLLINGVSIPLVYWRTLYTYRRSKQWSGLKQRWSEYKFLVQEFRSLGKNNFWVKYSVNGVAMPMSAILKALRKARRRANDATAQNARMVFGENFSRIFSYKKHHTTSVIRNDGAIARRYHALQRDGSDGTI